MKKFSEIIKKLRIEKDLTQEELAQMLGTSKSTIAMWETGKREPSKELYEEIADFFNVDIDYLYGRTDIRKTRHYDNDGNEYINSGFVRENDSFYINDESRMIAQEIFHNKELRALFDASRNVKAEDLEIVKNLLISLKNKERQ